jgi:hypothetical protein
MLRVVGVLFAAAVLGALLLLALFEPQRAHTPS